MPSASSLLALALIAATSCASNPLDAFSKIRSYNHDALLSPSHKNTKWLVFPQQQELHTKSVQGSLHANHEKVSPSSFFEEHATPLGLDQHAVLTKSREFESNSGSVTHQKYQQSIQNVPVYGGEFHLTVGSHNGVMTAHGMSLHISNVEDHDVALAQKLNNKGISDAMEHDLLVILEQFILSHHDLKVDDASKSQPPLAIGSLTTSAPTTVVWTRTGQATDTDNAALTFYVQAACDEPRGSYDAFIDITTKKVVQFVDKTERASPFESPIDAEVKVYNQYLKDYNDDEDDNYYFPDPDRYSDATRVFDTTTSHTYPSTDEEINVLVDYTLYTANLYNSLSNGQIAKWNSALPFNIEFNLSIANAYFDGTWGIHFGSGFITDDVVVHEWAHAYTQLLADLFYQGESGALNEAFSDIFGEAVDLLVQEGPVAESDMRSVWPLQCHDHVGVQGVSPTGTDKGFRWAMGENVTAGSGGQIRDMYYPECHYSPSTVYSHYYMCSEYTVDGSGVHYNSGVLNRLFAVLTDGGEYANPIGGNNLVVTALGLTKTLNLFYQAQTTLTTYSQFYDAATALSITCSNLIGQDIYRPNVLNSSVVVSSEKITAADCSSVANALAGSGMTSPDPHCPNLVCSFDTYLCQFEECSSAAKVSNDGVDYSNSLLYTPWCGTHFTGIAKYARVFERSDFADYAVIVEESDISDSLFQIECIKFGYVTRGRLDATFELFIDANGGDPDDDTAMTSLGSFTTTIENAGIAYSTGLVTLPDVINVTLSFSETLVVVMSHTYDVYTPGLFYASGYGQVHSGADRSFVGGSCISGYQPYEDYCNAHVGILCSYGPNWLVELSLRYSEEEKDSGGNDDFCFHVETKIDYKGVSYSYEELKAGKEPECTVPHAPVSKGVVISTSCDKSVRVTDTHLMATTKGFQLAYSLKAGDELFGDYNDELCTVQSVKKEKTSQQYFGLNCVHSEVLASGLRASTFGDFHTLPSWYMTYVGGLVGSEVASYLGEYIAEWYYSA